MPKFKSRILPGLILLLILLACQRPPLANETSDVPPPQTTIDGSVAAAPTLAGNVQTQSPQIQETVIVVEPTIAGAPVESPTQTPTTPTQTRLTDPGCCTEPFWSADGQQVRFIDKPSSDAFAGIYGVPINGGDVELVTTNIGFPQVYGRFLVQQNIDDQIEIYDVGADETFTAQTDAQRISISPGFQRIAWARSPAVSSNFDARPATVIVADIDGSNQTEVIQVIGGGFGGWVDDETILVAGSRVGLSTTAGLYTYSISTGELVLLQAGLRIRTVDVAPGGDWIFYSVTLSGGEAGAVDGLWVVSRDAETRYQLDVFGSAKWRDNRRLLIVPLELNVPSHRLLQFDAQTGQLSEVLTPDVVQFKIAQGDWSVSPPGTHIAYLSSSDGALWVIELPRSEDE